MKNLRYLIGLILAIGFSLLTISCLYTRHDIHITLDIRRIQDTAANVEDVVSGKKDVEEIEEKKSGAMFDSPTPRTMLARLFDPSATSYAQGDDSTELSPAAKKAVLNRKARFAEIRKYKAAGAIGENDAAMLETRSGDYLDKNKAAIETAVAEENADRMTIYADTAKQNGQPSSVEVQKAWAEIQRKNAEPGDWIQVPTDEKYYKRFLGSAIGQKLAAKPTQGQWIQVP